jgi:hypothetical protein
VRVASRLGISRRSRDVSLDLRDYLDRIGAEPDSEVIDAE